MVGDGNNTKYVHAWHVTGLRPKQKANRKKICQVCNLFGISMFIAYCESTLSSSSFFEHSQPLELNLHFNLFVCFLCQNAMCVLKFLVVS